MKAIWLSPEIIFTSSSSFRILFNSLVVLLGIILEKELFISELNFVLYSESLKLSVEANLAIFKSILTKIQAKVGLIFPSAEEKRVFSIAFFNILHFKIRLFSSLTPGITGKSPALTHFIFISPLSDFNSILSFFINSIVISLSSTKDI
jgi:hypothetical protein